MRRQILTAKSGISNHAAADIRDDPCLSKFGALPECSNVEETRNEMPAAAWKKYVNFASKNLPSSVYSGTFWFAGIPVILLINPKNDILIAAIPFYLLYCSSSPRKISLRSTSSASSFPSALACSSGYFDPVRSISITDA